MQKQRANERLPGIREGRKSLAVKDKGGRSLAVVEIEYLESTNVSVWIETFYESFAKHLPLEKLDEECMESSEERPQ